MKNKIPFHRPFPLEENEIGYINRRIKEILKSGQLTNGKWVKELENRIKDIYGVKYIIATANCTLGIYLCMRYKSYIGYIHMPNFTWDSPYLMLDDAINFHDINKETWLMKIPNISHKRNLLFPSHTFGNIIEIEDDYNVIYDGAHSLGSNIKKFGVATVFSLAATKLITACEGGLVLTNEHYLADFVRFRRDKCARMSEVNALIGNIYLDHMTEIIDWKKMVYKYYKGNIPGQFQKIPITSNYNTIGFLNYDKLKIPEHLETKQYYEPIYDIELLPNAYEVYKNIVCLPSYFGCAYKQIVEDIKEENE